MLVLLAASLSFPSSLDAAFALCSRALREVSAGANMIAPGGSSTTLYKDAVQLPLCSAHRLLSLGPGSHATNPGLRSTFGSAPVLCLEYSPVCQGLYNAPIVGRAFYDSSSCGAAFAMPRPDTLTPPRLRD
jgi:hypothetical protein